MSPPRPFLWLCVSMPPQLCKAGAGSSGLDQVWQAGWALLGPQDWALRTGLGLSEPGAGSLAPPPAPQLPALLGHRAARVVAVVAERWAAHTKAV